MSAFGRRKKKKVNTTGQKPKRTHKTLFDLGKKKVCLPEINSSETTLKQASLELCTAIVIKAALFCSMCDLTTLFLRIFHVVRLFFLFTRKKV